MRVTILALAAALAAGCTSEQWGALADGLAAASGGQGPYYSGALQPPRQVTTCSRMGNTVWCR